jgi:hypothetical protein
MIIAKQVISSIIEEKKKNNKEPSIASFTEIQSVVIQSLKSEINGLCKTGEIDKYKTLNGWAFTINIENK